MLGVVWCRRVRRAWARDERGQALVEAAIVMPLMVFFILGVIQMAMVQHARIMTEYAAFNAARAGIVWNADRLLMENAALISLMPTYEGIKDEILDPMTMLRHIAQRALLYQVNRRLSQAVGLVRDGADSLISQLPIGSGPLGTLSDVVLNVAERYADSAAGNAIGQALGADDDSMVRVDIINPSVFGVLGGAASNAVNTAVPGAVGAVGGSAVGGLFGGRPFQGSSLEIDFDDFEQRSNTRLTIRVRYMYMMRVPFANWVIHTAWMAGQAGKQLYGAIWNPQQNAPGETGLRNFSNYRNEPPGGFGFISPGAILNNIDQHDVKASAKLADEGVYVIPLNATYTMRMQSNVYKRSLQL